MDRQEKEHLPALLDQQRRISVTLVLVPLEAEETNKEEAPIVQGEVIRTEPLRKPVFFLRGNTPFLLALVFLGVCVFTLVSMILAFLLPQWYVHATVTIVPQQTHFSTRVTVSTPIRVLAPQQFAMATTVPAIGMAHQDATTATGFLTFYNAAPYGQIVPAGTLLISVNGVHIVTTSDAPIPPGNAPIEGQVTVSAHAGMPGSTGNIPALAINAQCCRENVFVKNLAGFAGGKDERDYHIVTKTDIRSASTTLNTLLHTSIDRSLTVQLHQGEALLPPVCTSQTLTDKNLGQEARFVTVTFSLHCSAYGYNDAALQTALTEGYLSQAHQRRGSTYAIRGSIATTIIQTSVHSTEAQVTTVCEGALVYAFSREEQHHIATLIAGTSKEASVLSLLRMPGVKQVGVTITPDTATMPSDVTRIAIIIEG